MEMATLFACAAAADETVPSVEMAEMALSSAAAAAAAHYCARRREEERG